MDDLTREGTDNEEIEQDVFYAVAVEKEPSDQGVY
jgi:hypothetical protein